MSSLAYRNYSIFYYFHHLCWKVLLFFYWVLPIFFMYLFIWPYYMAYGILVLWPGIEPASLKWKQSPNHWSTSELPKSLSLYFTFSSLTNHVPGWVSFFFSWRLITLYIVVVFVIHWHESAMDLHVFPIPIPPPTSFSTRSLWVFPVHQAPALVSCTQPELVICFTIDNICISMLLSRNIQSSPSPTESKSLFCTSVSFSVLHIGLSLPSF